MCTTCIRSHWLVWLVASLVTIFLKETFRSDAVDDKYGCSIGCSEWLPCVCPSWCWPPQLGRCWWCSEGCPWCDTELDMRRVEMVTSSYENTTATHRCYAGRLFSLQHPRSQRHSCWHLLLLILWGWITSWMFECLNVTCKQCLNVWMFECLNVWMFECLNI